MLKFLQVRLQQYVNHELSDVQAGFRKGRGTRDQHPLAIWKKTSVGNLKKQEQLKKQEFQRNIYFCFTDYTKAFDCVDHNKLWKIFKEMEYESTLTTSWEIYMQTKRQQLELDIEQQTGSKFEKEYVKAI